MNFSPKQSQEPIVYPTEVILASQSIGRRTILEKLGIRFRVIVSHVDESQIIDKDPVKMLQRRAIAKADEIVNHDGVYSLSSTAKSLIIAADTEAILGRKAYGKAENKDHAKEILKALMGRTHTVVTAVSIVLFEQGKEIKRWNKTAETKVTLRKMNSTDLELYVSRYDFTRFSAGYALSETPWDLITKIDGSYTNVIGLPLEILLPIFKAYDVVNLPKSLLSP
ncbi:MAG: Maf family nucleotide pyrophosphatase [Patescibacteria group bacterium]|nr:Maf family nucleotide pyrophosphatase [Patescibacteria group bacterium]